MTDPIPARVAALKTMPMPELKAEWRALFETEPPPFNRRHLENRIAYRIQELAYGGLFELVNIPADSLQLLLQVECPRLLFPFARRVVADATRDGGFPPLMIDPIDFLTLYRRRAQAPVEA